MWLLESHHLVQVWGYLDARTTFGEGKEAKTINIGYMVVNVPSSYNILLERQTINKLRAVVSFVHMKVKYPTDSAKVGVIRVNQKSARKCYEGSSKNTRRCWQIDKELVSSGVELDPMIDFEGERPQPAEEFKTIVLGEGRRVKIRCHLGAFAWSVSDMPGINLDFMCHHLSINTRVKSVVQKRRKFVGEKREIVDQELKKLQIVGYIREIQYPTWLANVVLVQKSNGKWRMCTDFTDLNKAWPKDSYLLPSIDMLVDGVAGCDLLSFMDAYSGYNQIPMHPGDVEKTAFRGSLSNFSYTVMPFGLKNARATYQRLMDQILEGMLGRNDVIPIAT